MTGSLNEAAARPRSTAATVGVDPDSGAASVLTTGDPPASARRAAAARAWLGVAERSDDPDDRAAAARRGLDELGAEHDAGDGATDDDTGQRITAAESSDDPAVRAALLSGALESRLLLYQWRYEDRGLRFDPPLDDPDDPDDPDDGDSP